MSRHYPQTAFLHILGVIIRRELYSYIATPLAYVFTLIYLALSGALTFYLGGFFTRGQADLVSFFTFQPWLFLFLAPAISMRLWSEERKSGTIELLMTLPVTTWQVVLGKYLAAWAFLSVAIVLTFPIWLTVNYLGQPDNGVILGSYIGTIIMAGGFLAVGSCVSAANRNQVVAFIISAVLCFLFLMSGLDLVQAALRGWLPDVVAQTIAAMSFLTHYTAIISGVIDLRDITFFGSLIGVCLFLNMVIIDLRKA